MTRHYGNKRRTKADKHVQHLMGGVYTDQSEDEVKALMDMGLTEEEARAMQGSTLPEATEFVRGK